MANGSLTGAAQHSPGSSSPSNPLLEARRGLEEAERLRQAGKLVQAQKLCEGILKQYPDYVGMLHTLGLVLADRHQYAQALPHLVQAAMLNPRDWRTLTVLSGVYLRLGAREMAVRTLEQAQALHSDDANILATLGEIYRENREYEAATDAYRRALQCDPSMHDVKAGLGNCCTHLGELEEAATALQTLVPFHPGSVNLLFALSQLPPPLITLDVLSLIEKAEPDPEDDAETFKSSVAFTRALALDKAGRHEEAWQSLLEANRPLAERHRAALTEDTRTRAIMLDDITSHTRTAPRPAAPPAGEALSLFILGPSRSGKTTAERIVGAIAGLKRGYENPILENAVRRTFQTAGLPTRDWLVELPPALDAHFREFYADELKERASGAQVFTNTHPGHITSALRIATVLPGARFLFVKRDMDDITLRIFMKKYREGNFYAYDVKTIRAYVEWYYKMIDALAERLPHITATIRYEDMIADAASVQNTAAALCGQEVPDGPVPTVGDDRDCGKPYAAFIAAALR